MIGSKSCLHFRPVAVAGRALLVTTCMIGGTAMAEPNPEVVTRSDITFQPLNPARGDAAPKAGVLWGDLKKNEPTGALIEFADGFSSPPHIHNITYRAIVISGAVHNDDPGAENLWMGPGSFWTQPAGESHITAAAPGGNATAFLEISEGPYLVQPTSEAFDNGERPVNAEARNIVWLDASDVTWVDQRGDPASAKGPEMAFLWGKLQEGQHNGTFLRLPAGTVGELQGTGAWLRSVVIKGKARYWPPGEDAPTTLDPGSYFGSKDTGAHKIACGQQEDCIIYVSTKGSYKFIES